MNRRHGLSGLAGALLLTACSSTSPNPPAAAPAAAPADRPAPGPAGAASAPAPTGEALKNAVDRGDAELAKRLVAGGADVDWKGAYDQTLQLAAEGRALRGRHGAALELQGRDAARAQRRAVPGLDRHEVALGVVVRAHQRGDPRAEQRLDGGRAGAGVLDRPAGLHEGAEVVDEAGDLERHVVGGLVREQGRALEAVGEEVDGLAVGLVATQREPTEQVVDGGDAQVDEHGGPDHVPAGGGGLW